MCHLRKAASDGGSLCLWDASNMGRYSSVIADSSALFSVAFSPNGRRLVSGGRERVIRIWSVPELEKLTELRGPHETVLSVTFSPDGKQVVSGSYDGMIHVWSLNSRDTLR